MNKKLIPFIISLTLGSLSTGANADNLLEVYQLALTKDPSVLKSAAIINRDKEGIVQAKSSLYPNLSFTTSVGKSVGSGSINVSTTGVGEFIARDTQSINSRYQFSLTQEVFNMKTWQNLEQSEKRSLQSEVSYKLAKQNLISRVAQVYFDILKAKDSLEFAQAEKKSIERQLEQTNQRFNVGLTAITDVHEARAQFDNSVATVIRSENAVEIQKELLREITGQYHQHLNVLNTERFSTSKMERSASDWVDTAQSNNQELQIQSINMDIAKNNIDIAFSGHLPTVNLSATKGRSNINASKITLFGQDPKFSNSPPGDSKSITLSVSVPIFSGFATDSSVKQAQANYVIAAEDRELAYRRIVRTIRTSYANVQTLDSTIKAQEQALLSAESALGATQAGAEVGTRTIVDVLDSTQKLFNAKRQLSSSRYDYILAVLNLKLAAGTVNESDVKGINSGLKN
ncbi:MAG: outer membrane channel protein TolC [Algicola sp.]|nr:outer membrane channel protein TolC [Algicola sp.]